MLTKEHAVQLGRLAGLANGIAIDMPDAMFVNDDTYQLQIAHNGYVCMRKNGVLYNEDVRCLIAQLQSLGYDMGYLKIKSLIEAGIAADKTTF